jgi:hypothetical protein
MATASTHRNNASQAAIFARLWESGPKGLSHVLAWHLLKLRFSQEDRARMHELATMNCKGQLSAQERQELDNYVVVGDLLAILHSKARKRLKQAPATGNDGHG